jgi:hypothetical protein
MQDPVELMLQYWGMPQPSPDEQLATYDQRHDRAIESTLAGGQIHVHARVKVTFFLSRRSLFRSALCKTRTHHANSIHRRTKVWA